MCSRPRALVTLEAHTLRQCRLARRRKLPARSRGLAALLKLVKDGFKAAAEVGLVAPILALELGELRRSLIRCCLHDVLRDVERGKVWTCRHELPPPQPQHYSFAVLYPRAIA